MNILFSTFRTYHSSCIRQRWRITIKATDSSFLKNIVKLWPKVEDNSLWQAGDDTTVRAWDSKWLGHDIRISYMDVSIPLHLRNAKVAYLIEEDGDWNWEMINQWLSENVTCRIASMLPPSIEAGPDCRVSFGVHGSQFTIGEMYDILDEENRHEKEERWRQIWKLQSTERV